MSTVVRSAALRATATFTSTAAEYTAGDALGGAQEFSFGSLARPAGHITITSATLEIDGGTIETTAWRLHLFNVTPPSALADNAAFALAAADRASYLGYVDFSQALDLGDTMFIDMPALGKQIVLGNDDALFGYLVNGTTLTPAAVAHKVTLYAKAT